MNALGALLTAVFSIIVLAGSRRLAALAVIGATCYITQGQQVNLAGFHFTAIRMVLLFGIIRCFARGETRVIKLTPIDKALIGYALSELCIYTLREKTSEALVYQLGCAYDIIYAYFLFRSLILSVDEAREFARGLVFMILPFASLMVIESVTGQNLFRAMGGQGWEMVVSRGERFRCIGSFRGPHTAGIFGASLLPIFFGLWLGYRSGLPAVLGVIAAWLITFTSNSSGPLMTLLGGLVGLAFWFFRYRMKKVRRGLVFTLIALHLYMKAPVWFLFAKMGNITGGDGFQRSWIINQAIYTFPKWWLLGLSSAGDFTGDPADTGLDVTDQYVASGLNGGILGMFFFILIIVRCFGGLGRAMDVARRNNPEADGFLWGLGSALFAHVMGLFTVSYFDQVYVVWWGLLAIISSISASAVTEPAIAVVKDDLEPIRVEVCPN